MSDEEPTFLQRCGYNTGLFLGTVGIILAVLGTVTAGALVHGFVIMTMWQWFMVPLGLMPLGLAHATGIGFYTRYLIWNHAQQKSKDKDESNERFAQALALAFIYPFVVLGFAWICHAFM